jgi:hypothetical protein
MSSEIPCGLVVSPPGSSGCYLDHVQHTTDHIRSYPARAAKVRYKIEATGYNNPWADPMRPYMQRLLGTDSLGAKTLELQTAAWAKSTSEMYNSAIKPYFEFCEEEGLPH